MNRSSKQNINKDIAVQNNAMGQCHGLHICIYVTSQPKEAKYTFLSNAYGTFSKIDHMIGHKTSLNKFKKIEIISSIFSDHKGLKLETNLREKTQKHSNFWRLSSILLNNEWVNNEIKEEIKKFLETNKNEITTVQNLWETEKAVLGRKFIVIKAYLKKDRNISNKHPNLTSTRTGGTTTNKTQREYKEGNNQDQSRIKWHRD